MKLTQNQEESWVLDDGGWVIVSSIKPYLFLAYKAINIEHFHDINSIPLKTFETKIELGLSYDPRKIGF